ncbi:MAG: T9SS C-terminal target domain-containing protein, partial [Ignavibacteriales bacterium]
TVLKVYDVLGNEVAILVNEYKPAGSYEVTFDASSLSSGIYFYKLHSGTFFETKKMLLIK